MDTIKKDKRRFQSFKKQNNYYEAWNISHKYSTFLLRKINHNDIYNLCFMIHKEFINELKVKKIDYNQNKNYIQVWETMLNSISKNHNTSSIRLLQQTSQQKNL